MGLTPLEPWQVERVLRGDWADAAVEAPRLEVSDWRDIGCRMREECGRSRILVPPVHICTVLDVPLSSKVPAECREVTDGRKIWYRPGLPRRMGEALFHGLGHVLGIRWGYRGNETDAWGIAGQFAFPDEIAERIHCIETAKRLQPHAPEYLLRGQIMGVLRRLRAA